MKSRVATCFILPCDARCDMLHGRITSFCRIIRDVAHRIIMFHLFAFTVKKCLSQKLCKAKFALTLRTLAFVLFNIETCDFFFLPINNFILIVWVFFRRCYWRCFLIQWDLWIARDTRVRRVKWKRVLHLIFLLAINVNNKFNNNTHILNVNLYDAV